MSDKIALDDVASGYNLSKINVNFDKIETELNDKVLYRDPPDGAPNEMSTDLDMNGNKIYNLAKPTSPHEPLRLIDAAEIAAGGEFPINTTISSSGSGASLVRSPEGVVRSLTGVGHIQTVVDGDDMLITTTAEANTAASIGTGTPLYANKVGANLLFKSLKAGTNVTLYDSGTEVTINSTGGVGSGEANTASNVGTGTGVFKTKSGVDLQFKTLKAGTNVTLSSTADEVTINSTGGGGGGTWDGFADITDFGAVADFVPGAGGTGTGTSNDTAVMNAIATGKPLYIPAGNFYVANWATRLAYSRATVHGNSTGFIWGDTGRGKQILGKTLFVGATNTHEVSYGGGINWAPNGSYAGSRIWTGHHNWMVVNSENGPMQFQLYPGYGGKAFQGITAHCVSPNKLVADSGSFDTSQLRVGMHVGWYGTVYKVASIIDASNITVTTFAGTSPAFTTDATPRPFFFSYECAMITANVSGTTVTRVSGDALPYGYAGDHMYAIINGTYYNVTNAPETTGSPHTLTLATSAGTLTNATVEFYRGYGPWAYVTLFRLQGLGGGIETNGGMAYNIKNELRVWNGGTDAALFGPIKINAVKTAIGPGDGGNTTGERLEVEADGVWLGSSSSNASTLNAFKVYGGGIGYTPVIAARGAESTRGMGFDIQGTGKFGYTSGTYARTNFEIYANGTSNSWVSVDGGTNIAYIDARSTNANADLQLAPKGTGRAKVNTNNIADEGTANQFSKYQRVRNYTGPDPLTGAVNAYGFNAVVTANSGNTWQCVPGMFVGQSTGGTGTVWGIATEAWSGNAASTATSDVALVGIENAVISQYPLQSQKVIGNNAVFKNRADGVTSVLGGLGSNAYNRNSYAYWLTSQNRSSAGEYCGWSRGIMFDSTALDSSVDGKAIGIDMSAVSLTKADCLKFPDGSVQNGGQGAWRGDAASGDSVVAVNSTLTKLKFSAERFNIGGIGSYNAATQRFTFSIAGVYQINATNMCTVSVATTNVNGFLFVRRNGSNLNADSVKGSIALITLNTGQTVGCTSNGLLSVNAGDYIEVYMYYTFTGGTLTAVGGEGQPYTSLSISKVA